jgi:hypothetical protein
MNRQPEPGVATTPAVRRAPNEADFSDQRPDEKGGYSSSDPGSPTMSGTMAAAVPSQDHWARSEAADRFVAEVANGSEGSANGSEAARNATSYLGQGVPLNSPFDPLGVDRDRRGILNPALGGFAAESQRACGGAECAAWSYLSLAGRGVKLRAGVLLFGRRRLRPFFE